MEVAYKRVLLKLSGEALAGTQKNGIDVDTLGKIWAKVKEIVELKNKIKGLFYDHFSLFYIYKYKYLDICTSYVIIFA